MGWYDSGKVFSKALESERSNDGLGGVGRRQTMLSIGRRREKAREGGRRWEKAAGAAEGGRW